MLTVIGLGLLVSLAAHTGQQAQQTVLFIMLPMMLLSGSYSHRIDAGGFGAGDLRDAADLGGAAVARIFVKGVGFGALVPELLVLAAFAILIFWGCGDCNPPAVVGVADDRPEADGRRAESLTQPSRCADLPNASEPSRRSTESTSTSPVGKSSDSLGPMGAANRRRSECSPARSRRPAVWRTCWVRTCWRIRPGYSAGSGTCRRSSRCSEI